METDGWKHLRFSHLIENQNFVLLLTVQRRDQGDLVFFKFLKKELICLFPQIGSHFSLCPLPSSWAVQQLEEARQKEGNNSEDRKLPSLYHKSNLWYAESTPESLKYFQKRKVYRDISDGRGG